MNREEIMKLAERAGASQLSNVPGFEDFLVHFFILAGKAERDKDWSNNSRKWVESYREDIIAMAEEAFEQQSALYHSYIRLLLHAEHINPQYLKHFAELAADDEREACAQIADDEWMKYTALEEMHHRLSSLPFNPNNFDIDMSIALKSKHIADLIRERGDK